MNGFTKADNWLWDYVMPKAKPNTFKVVCAVMRATCGWHQEKAELTFDDLKKMTGMESRGTLARAVNDALEEGYIERTKEGRTFSYSLKIGPYDSLILRPQEDEAVSKSDREQSQNRTDSSLKIVLPTSGVKEKERKEKERGGSPSPNGHKPEPDPVLADMVNALSEVTGMSGRLNWPELSGEARLLLDGGYTAQQVRTHYGRASPSPGTWHWYRHDWRGKKERDEYPRLANVRETIAGAVEWQPMAEHETSDWLADLEYRTHQNEEA